MDKKSIGNLEFDKIIKLLEEKTNTELGKMKASRIEIYSTIEEVKQKQDETSESQKLILEGSSLPIRSLKDMAPKLRLANLGSSIDPLALINIANNLRAARLTKDKLMPREDLPLLKEKAENLFFERQIEERIFESILSEDEISDNASGELRKIRREIQSSKEKIKTKLNQIISSDLNAKYLQESIVTMRQDRYVIPVKAEARSRFPGIVHDSSASGASLFIEPMAVVDLNNGLRILGQKEREEIERILLELSNEVGNYSKEIIENQELLSELDFIMGRGAFSVSLNGISPKLNNNKIIVLKNAKHPLLNKSTIVPLNFQIGNQYSTLVITGPNTGGKTVALKTVGLFVLMVQAGLHIPCDFGSSVAVFDNVFSDIGDDQSISQNLSTFSSHMTNIVRILHQATRKSLIIFDELGSGTDPDEGSALAMAILEHLKNEKITTIATTHYSDLKSYALNTEFVENASVEFDVETLSPTYRLLIGVPGKSNAFFISQKLGLGQSIIEKAKTFLHDDAIKMEDILLRIEKDRVAIEKERIKIAATSENVQSRLKNLERKEKQLDQNKERIIKEAKKSAKQIVNEAKSSSDKIVSNLREMEKDYAKLSNKELEKLRMQMTDLGKNYDINEEILVVQDAEDAVSEEFIIPGNSVYVSSFQRNATIVTFDPKKKQAVVQMDNMKINVPYSALQNPKIEKKENPSTRNSSIASKKAKNIKSEVDIRGLDLEEAMDRLTKYLDDAYLSNVQMVTIIHGIGTGVLKKGVESMLKSLKYIKKYRPGSYGEGGQGVTIVDFK